MSCTTVLVGKNASNDRSTMIARTDDGHFDVKKLIVVEPKDQPKKYKSVLSHLEIELPEAPLRYTACPNVDPKDGIWAATGINAANVGTGRPKAGRRKRLPGGSGKKISSFWFCPISAAPGKAYCGWPVCWNGTAPMSPTGLPSTTKTRSGGWRPSADTTGWRSGSRMIV